MLRAFSTAATGMTAQQMMLDVITNNLANLNTNGFKRSQIVFQDLLYVKLKEAGTEVASGVISPAGIEIGSGVRPASIIKVLSAGELQGTENELDVAIMGEGFLQVIGQDGSLRYTRDGALQKGPNGELVTATGYLLEPSITIPTDAGSCYIEKDGSVNITDPSGTPSVVGNLELARFPNPSGLASEGDNLLKETQASGTPVVGTPGENGFGTIQAGFLEKSNVQMVSELVGLITAQRAYEINARAIKAGDDMLQTTNNIVR